MESFILNKHVEIHKPNLKLSHDEYTPIECNITLGTEEVDVILEL